MSQYEVTRGPTGGLIKSWTKGVDFARNAQQQLVNISEMPFIHHHVAAMPDVHLGIGATVGSVVATKGAIIPAAVGVDIGCGMMAIRTSLTASQLPENLSALRSSIEAAIPHGRTSHGGVGDKGAWAEVPDQVLARSSDGPAGSGSLAQKYMLVTGRHPKVQHKGAWTQLGTLGTGNHFVEVCLDEAQDVWVMLHSGSRGAGNAIGTYFISEAKELMARYFITLPDKDLAYLPEGTDLFRDYVAAVGWAQEYARVNRELMMDAALQALEKTLGIPPLNVSTPRMAVNCHHNYVEMENHFGANVLVTRKGAVRARAGDLGIIPGSMGTRSYIVRGKGNPDSFNSCSHGAGRKMSRTEALKTFTIEDHVKATAGVECRKDAEVVDETPGAYKDIDAVMAAQSDLVEVVHTLKQVVCVKG